MPSRATCWLPGRLRPREPTRSSGSSTARSRSGSRVDLFRVSRPRCGGSGERVRPPAAQNRRGSGDCCTGWSSLVPVFINTVTYFSGVPAQLAHFAEGGAHATPEPTRHRAGQGGTRGAGGESPQVYVTVSGRHPSEDHPPRRTGVVQRAHRLATGSPAADCQQVAQAVLPGPITGARGRAAGRAPSPLFPPA
jgi:hypothetical protein